MAPSTITPTREVVLGATTIVVDALPDLDLRAFVVHLRVPLGEHPSPPWLTALLEVDADVPFTRDDALRADVRDLLRHGGYKPTGRGKPASEYLAKAAVDAKLSSINLVVDAGNAVSLHSGLPVSVVDLDRAQAPLRVGLGAERDTYVFNASGQTIDVRGLPCLIDAAGPCANAVKDSQRTKTHAETTRCLALVWGTLRQTARVDDATRWFEDLLERAGATLTRAPAAGPTGPI